MKIDKAIEILSDSDTIKVLAPSPDFEDAIKLGIEALKRLDHDRIFHNYHNLAPLPGETE